MADDYGGKSGTLKSLKDRWRSKSNADKSAGQVPQDVTDFLRPQSNSSNSRPPLPLAPKIDIAAAQRWAGNSAELRSANGGIATPSSLRGRGGSQKKPRRPNLRVGFDEVPEIMGEGGDECEDPTLDISKAKERNPSKSSHQLARKAVGSIRSNENRPMGRPSHTPPPGATPPHVDYGTDEDERRAGQKNINRPTSNAAQAAAYRSLFGEEPEDPTPSRPKSRNDDDEDNFRPPPLRRAATGFSTRESMSSHYSDEGSGDGSPTTAKPPTSAPFRLPEINSHDSPIDFGFDNIKRHDTDESVHVPELQSKIQRMRQEEGRMMHQNARRSIIDLAGEDLIAPQKKSSQYDEQPESYESDIYDMYHSSSPTAARRSPEKPRNPPVSSATGPTSREPRLPVLSSSYQDPSRSGASSSLSNNGSSSTDTQYRQQQKLPYRPSPNLNASLPTPPDTSTLSPSQGAPNRPSPSPLAIPGKDYVSTIPRNADLYASAGRQSSDPRTPATATSTRTPGSALGQAALEEFGRRCSHMKGIFRLQAEFEKPIAEYSATQWLRAAAWWFVKGRSGLEQLIRSRPRTAENPLGGAKDELLSQPHVDLAKCWWILSEILSSHASLPRPMSPDMSFSARASAAGASQDIESAEFFDSCEILHSNLKALLTSMNKNNLMPPSNALIQGQDQTIWIPYPQFPTDLLPILTGKSRSLTSTDSSVRVFDPMSVMAVADTNAEFAYYKWFVKVSLGNGDDHSEQISLLCLFSVMRPRNEWHPKIAICTQKELVTIVVTGDRRLGPSWEDVKWSEQDTSLQIKLPHGYVINAQLNPPDYQMLASMYKKAYAVQSSLFPLDNEIVAYETQLADFLYNDTMRPPAFPLERQRRCRVRLHVKYETRAEGTGARKFYRGMRILITSSPKSRTLGNTSHDLGIGCPVVIEMLTENTPSGESFPAMAIHYKEPHRQCSMFMVFAQLKERQDLYSALNQADIASEEMQYAGLRLRKLTVEPIGDFEGQGSHNPLGRMQWQELTVINRDPFNPDDDFGQTVLSDDLRIIAHGAGGSITDRINVGPGELRIRVMSDGTPGITVLRQPQDDLTMTFDRRIAPFTLEQAEELYHATQSLPTKRTFTFYNPDDLHAFQKSITAFSVKFDGLARSFTISRRRPMTALSKHKKLEANLTRVQVVSHDDDKIVQLLVFFDNEFPYAESLGFVLKGVDVFERYDGSKMGAARCGVRIVDAKFSLPKEKSSKARPEDIERPFVCLDMPEYPAENDDIWVGFDEEEERERFLRALPAPATSHSRGMGGVFGKR